MIRRFILVSLVCAVPSLADAATYYTGKAGSDGNSCATAQNISTPKLTIISGKGCLTTPGDTLIVRNGTYVESHINMTVSGTQANPITIRAENNQLAILSSTSSGAGCQPNISFNASWITIDGLRGQINPSDASGCAASSALAFVRMWDNYEGGTVRNCLVDAHSNRSVGIKSNQNNSLVENCVVHNSLEGFIGINQVWRNNTIGPEADDWGDHFTAKGGARNTQFYNNIIYSTGNQAALRLGGNSSCCWFDGTHFEGFNQVAYNNVIVVQSGTGQYAVQVTGCQDCALYNNVVIGGTLSMSTGSQSGFAPQPWPTGTQIKNNIFSCNGVAATGSFGSATGTVLNYNNFYNCTSVPSQTNPITGNPLFVNAASDWHLQAGSPAIGTGTVATMNAYPSGTITVNLDKDGVTRTVPWDLGIYKYGAASGDTTPPTAPSNLSVVSLALKRINLAWTLSTDDTAVTNYYVEQCAGAGCSTFSQVGTTSGLTYSDTGLLVSSPYSYRVRATDAANNLSSYSATATATVPPVSYHPTLNLRRVYWDTFDPDIVYLTKDGERDYCVDIACKLAKGAIR